MKIDEIIKKKINPLRKLGRVRATVIREKGKYVVKVMLGYTAGKGLGSMGSKNVLDVIYETQYLAQKLVDEINKLPDYKERLDKLYERLVLKENNLLTDIKRTSRWKDEEGHEANKKVTEKFVAYLDKFSWVKIKDKSTAVRLIIERLAGTSKAKDPVWNNLSTDKSSTKYFQRPAIDPSEMVIMVNTNFLSRRKGNKLGGLGKPQRVADMIAKGKKFDSVPFYSVRTGVVEEGNHRVDAFKKMGVKSVPIRISGAWD